MTIKIDDTLELKQVQTNEYQALYALVDNNRTQLREWLPWVDYMTAPGQYVPIIKDWIEMNDALESLTLGVYSNGELAGMCGFNRIVGMSRRAEVGYWLAEEYTGTGMMSKAVTGLINYGFDELGLHRIEIIAGVENKKSRKIPERLKFTEEAVMKDYEFLYDHYHNCALYRMLKKDWLTLN
ncbi:ribosomal-protein-serine acetyltransferase [Jeotgalicoccus coquinae]|uniref:Ribosomal N-acetyltransferase YdaF n=1 Tax=Jeotgalicoccus coquinae TaxID=709509 RepID=A0A6V7R8W5_9STAP|nr:GNAT family protein [Jeotgalicoccus coquinae]MBB6423081.1 ribosomal-protein-serine acetyltransferase [Jeotgalicoccus coquinae]GGE10823.1 ribosomal-protein-serine acetyltransferase [Jeotgalicoccus coquinae]CAD2073454.1 Putative ribosomal N-acetyltransferase YdaF [Jeotgalicoccus coquinae]